MSTLVHRNGTSIVDELMSWMGSAGAEPQIRVEEFRDGDRMVIRADIPGVDPRQDIDLTLEDGVLRLRGERRTEERDHQRSEVRYGRFERVLAVPAGTRAEDVAASYVAGVLTVSFPATDSGAPQRIPVTDPGEDGS